MAIDTRDKRMSLIGLASPVPRMLPNPDGAAFSLADRGMLLYLYHGIEITQIIITGVVDLTLAARSAALTLVSRSAALTLSPRTTSLTLEERP